MLEAHGKLPPLATKRKAEVITQEGPSESIKTETFEEVPETTPSKIKKKKKKKNSSSDESDYSD
jgi:hypothetical protein